jgi:PAS domain-containing protein
LELPFKGYGDGSVDFFDDKIEALTGYPKADFDSRRLTWPDLIFPEDLPGTRDRFIEALKTSRAYEREYRIRKKIRGNRLASGHGPNLFGCGRPDRLYQRRVL